MNSKLKSILKAGVPLTILVFGAVAAMMYMPSIHDAIYPQPKETKVWHLIQSYSALSEGDPGAGTSGFLEIYFTNHSADPDNAYNENTSATIEAWCVANMPGKTPYATADAFNTELNYGVTFDIVVRVRFNKTNAWDGAKFIGANVRVNITLTGFGTAGMTDIVGSQVITKNTSTCNYIWLNYYWQDVDGALGSGYTITKGSPWTVNKITEIKIWAKF